MTLHSYDENWIGNCRVCGAIPSNHHSSHCHYATEEDKRYWKLEDEKIADAFKKHPIVYTLPVLPINESDASAMKIIKKILRNKEAMKVKIRCRNIKCSKLITLEQNQEACYSCGTLFVELPEKPAPLWDEFGMTIEKDGDESKGVPPRGGGI